MKYSNTFNFFFQHQIMILTSQNGKETTFSSAIKKELFKKVKSESRITQDQIKAHCVEIHKALMREQNKSTLFKTDLVLFNTEEYKVARFTYNGEESDIILFSDRSEAEENQQQGEHIISCVDLPLQFRTELLKQIA